MLRQREHPVPTERRVIISDLDRRYNKLSVEEILWQRGFDPALPYREESTDLAGTLYVQDIPSAECG